MRGISSYAAPWDDLMPEQQNNRCAEVLRHACDFIYVALRDAYRRVDAQNDSPDYAPAQAVETYRKLVADREVRP